MTHNMQTSSGDHAVYGKTVGILGPSEFSPRLDRLAAVMLLRMNAHKKEGTTTSSHQAQDLGRFSVWPRAIPVMVGCDCTA